MKGTFSEVNPAFDFHSAMLIARVLSHYAIPELLVVLRALPDAPSSRVELFGGWAVALCMFKVDGRTAGMRGVCLVLTVFLVGCSSGTIPIWILLPDGRGAYTFSVGTSSTDAGAIERAVAGKVKTDDICPDDYDLVATKVHNKSSFGMTFSAIVACR
ncbi:hypothetical protein HL658_34990 [Azospirillum sp. RWY-5-1]|uniref:Uncharacterized protein n=1 Tax=Azospirillum oleiclasticum TaxID=2735135 RepID=A0ABX2TAU7_9PROT|nr:hypothetical protein [Azospirillum oleiclasticum]NYZ17779.1 hypothetical protein [Azospirillum oleiclasticum]NYZ21464.1 hypothetical protein [Azospirillum oleiclasticum]